MRERTLRALRRRPIRTGALVLCGALIVVIALGTAVDCARYVHFRIALDRATVVTPVGRTIDAGWAFRFVQSRYAVRVAIDEADLAAARAMDTTTVFGSSGWLRRVCVTELVRAQSQSRLVDELAAEFRRIRDARRLTDDEYLELITSAVQQIPYAKAPGGLQLPAEVLTSGVGICTDKSVLLGSLLIHEGYDSALWVFETPSHVALGVASQGARFQGTRYAFLETTIPRFIGQAGAEYLASGPIARPPQLIALGGWRSYASGTEVDIILRELARARAAQIAWQRYAGFVPRDSSKPRFVKREMENWIAGATTRFILANTHDRGGVYAMLRGRGAGAATSDGVLAQ